VYTTSVTRDDNGNPTSVTQANGVVTSYSYDALDRMTAVTTHPATGTDLVTAYTLDAEGHVTNRHTADGVDTAYSFDNLGRLTQISATGLSTISYAYDELSRRTSMTDVTGTTSYSYDRMGRLLSAAQPNGTLAYAYDRDSNRTTLTYPGSLAVTYTFSSAGRLSSLADWGSRTTSYTYTAAGLAKTVTLPSSMVTTYTYDRAQRLTSLTNVISSTTITSHAYTLDAEGNRTALTEFVSGITSGASDSFGFTYDGLERLTGVTTTNAESFTLDGASNITARTGPSRTFTIDNSNRPTSDGTNTLTWSAADRLTGRGSDTFGYDPLDRLSSSTVSSTARTYAYSGDGLLQSRTTGGSTTSLLWDPATSPSRLLQSGPDTIVYGLGPLYSVNGSTVTTYARDGQKSIRAELNGSSVTGSWRYRAYGEIVQYSGSATPSLLGYAGQLLDPSGLYYMRARWYDATNARFLSRDPAKGDQSNPSSLNAFDYAGANPAMLADPSGYCLDPDPDSADVRYCFAAFIPYERVWVPGFGTLAGNNRLADPYNGASKVTLLVHDDGRLEYWSDPSTRYNDDGSITVDTANPQCAPSGDGYYCSAGLPFHGFIGPFEASWWNAPPIAFQASLGDGMTASVQGTGFPSLEIWRYDASGAAQLFNYDSRFAPLGPLHLFAFGNQTNMH
jgi:RHS repeat-associated protein